MTSSVIANFEKMLGSARDGALLRYSLGNEWLKAGDPGKAAGFLRDAVTRDAQYSAAWKLLGKALAESGDPDSALEAYTQGILVAETKGDKQAAKEMRVFAKRLMKRPQRATS
jgi:predicted Zn-dependent protease